MKVTDLRVHEFPITSKRQALVRLGETFRSVANRKFTKAQAESVNAAGGVVVGTELANVIKTHRDATGVIRANAQFYQMAGDSVTFTRRTAGLSAPTWTAENSAVSESAVGKNIW